MRLDLLPTRFAQKMSRPSPMIVAASASIGVEVREASPAAASSSSLSRNQSHHRQSRPQPKPEGPKQKVFCSGKSRRDGFHGRGAVRHAAPPLENTNLSASHNVLQTFISNRLKVEKQPNGTDESMLPASCPSRRWRGSNPSVLCVAPHPWSYLPSGNRRSASS